MKKIIVILFTLFSLYAYSVKQKISGHVINTTNNEHVPFISISIKGTTVGTVTDVSGHYTLQNSLLGKQILVVKGLGFIPVEKEITIETGKPIEANFEVMEDVVSLNDVVVSSNRNETTRKEASIVVGVLNPRRCLMRQTPFV
jgi:outer membrane receptor for ferrienterochelin and colicins